MEALYNIPPLVFLIGALVLAVAFACGGQIYVHRRFPRTDFIEHNEVGGFIIAVVGSLYAVLLGFLTVVVWQHFSESREQVSREAAAAADVWHTCTGLPYKLRSHIREDMEDYADIMIKEEWPAMRHGGFSTKADLVTMDAIGAVSSFKTSDARESNAQLTTQQQLAVLHDERQRRLANNDSDVSRFAWLVLFIGGLSTISFCWLFGLRNAHVHLLMTSTVALVVAATLVLLFELQYPFRSNIGISPDAWHGLIAHIHLMETGGQPAMRL